jgi:hypothetical protein
MAAEMYRHVYDPDFRPTVGIGSFQSDPNNDFKQTIKDCFESFENSYQINPIQNFKTVVSSGTLWEDFKDKMFGDVLEASSDSSFDHYAAGNDEYLAMHSAKMGQLIENSRQMLVDEASNVGMLSPIVTATMPVLKKEYILNQFKDMVHTIVTDTPIIKYAYERRFLKDAAGNRKYFPECFYDGSYAEFTDQSIGKLVNKAFNATVNGQLVQFNALEASGGSLSRRDALGYDFSVDGLQIKVPSTAEASGEVVELTNLDIRPDYATKTFNNTIEIPSKVEGVETPTEIYVYGTVDAYTGIVNIAISTNNAGVDLSTAKVQFGGHLSNSNNDAIIELDKLRENRQFTISEKERFNAGLTIERIREEKALANIDVTVEMVSDMSDVAAQTTDSNTKRYLEDSYINTQAVEQTRVFQPMGYNFQFADAFRFDLEAPGPYMVPESEWRSKQIRFYFERVLAYLKTKLRDERIMFSISANTYVIELLTATDNDIKWVLNTNSNVGGVQLDYKFGVTTVNGTRVQFIASQKEEIAKGFRIVVLPLTDTVITYRQYQFSFNIETNYRNPITPNIPNIMCCQRYENVSVLPIQSNFFIKEFRENNLGTSPRDTYKKWMSVHNLL